MKNLFTRLFAFLFLVFMWTSCDMILPGKKNNPNVYSISYNGGSSKETTLGSIKALYDLISKEELRAGNYKNFEIFTSSCTLNWNFEKKILFMNYTSDTSCYWQHIYKDVTEDKLKDFKFENEIEADVIKSLKAQFDKSFTPVTDEKTRSELISNYINTNYKCK